MDPYDPESGETNPYASPADAPPYGPEPPQLTETDSNARMMGMLCHLTGLTSFLGIPGFVGPLVIWLIKKDEMAFVDDQGKESLNFQLTLMIAYVVAVVLTFVTCGFGVFVLIVPAVLNLIFCIMGTVKANNGEYYRYPMNIRMIN